MSKIPLRALIVANDIYDPRVKPWGNDDPRVKPWGNDDPRLKPWGNDDPRLKPWGNDGICFYPLQGCVRDAQSLHQWLAGDPDFDLQAVVLYNQDATKANIIRGFQEHLALARPGESVLFYFSGHGTSELADTEIWTGETDGRLEGIACYYDQANARDFILADKELRYLLHSISKPGLQITALFDCCHSGDNTRAAAGEKLTPKRAEAVFSQRPWAHFLFARQYPRETVLGKNTRDFLPEGDYLSLAASESDQSAVEANIGGQVHGVFTYHLLEILRQSGGHVSYRDLANQLRNRLRFKYSQRTKIYAPRADRYEEGFLQKTLPDLSIGQGTLTYNSYTNQYWIDRGILARVTPNVTRIQVKTAEDTTITGRVSTVNLNTAQVVFDHEMAPQTAMTARMDRLAGRVLRIHFVNKDLLEEEADTLAHAVFSLENQSFIQQESEEKNADYTLLAWAGMYYLTLKNDWFRPLILPIKIDSDNAEATLLQQLRQVALWHFFKDLENTGADLIPHNFLQIEVFDKQGNPLNLQENVLTSRLSSTGQINAAGQMAYEKDLEIRVTNHSAQNLYVAVLWLADFGIAASAITNPDSGRAIPPGKSETLEIFGSKTVTLELDGTTRLFHKENGSSTLKFIFSTEPFESRMLDLEALPLPEFLATRSNFKQPQTPENLQIPQAGWNTRSIEIRTLNPEFEFPDLKILKSSLDPATGDPYLAHFLTDIYLQKKSGTSARYEQQRGLEVLESGGFFWDSILTGANYWANYRRNSRYAKMAKKYPDLPKIVSEGDSWFQHPLLDDIIDNVGRFYPTYCLAAAGDTLRHYFAANQIAAAVEKIQPTVLLLSGGGNDILGDDLPRFLAEKIAEAPEGQQFERYFNQTFAAELDGITEIYRALFDYMQAQHPQVKIVTHSYDYPRPVGFKSTKRNWIGQYLDKKGISREGDRKALVHYMLDQFNLRMKNLADEYPGVVYYLDLRNSVLDGQWDDEIHPNNPGFQNVSTQFLRLITGLVSAPR